MAISTLSFMMHTVKSAPLTWLLMVQPFVKRFMDDPAKFQVNCLANFQANFQANLRVQDNCSMVDRNIKMVLVRGGSFAGVVGGYIANKATALRQDCSAMEQGNGQSLTSSVKTRIRAIVRNIIDRTGAADRDKTIRKVGVVTGCVLLGVTQAALSYSVGGPFQANFCRGLVAAAAIQYFSPAASQQSA